MQHLEFSYRVAKTNELELAYDLIKRVMKIQADDPFIDFEKFCALYEKNKEALYLVEIKDSEKQTSICGYFQTLMLNKSGHEGIRTNHLCGLNVEPSHLVHSREVPDAVYIGGVGALSDKEARKSTMLAVISHVYGLIDKYQLPVYLRPVTEDGDKIAKKFDFRRLACEPVEVKGVPITNYIFFDAEAVRPAFLNNTRTGQA